jgi:hypothetical protein
MPKRHAQLKEYSIVPSKGSTANCAQLNEVQRKTLRAGKSLRNEAFLLRESPYWNLLLARLNPSRLGWE